MPNRFYEESLVRGKREHGSKWSTASLDAAPQFVRWFGTGQRIKVTRHYGEGEAHTRCGTVSRTNGRVPCFLLMHRSNAAGSSDVLGPDDTVIAVQRGSRYVAVPEQEK